MRLMAIFPPSIYLLREDCIHVTILFRPMSISLLIAIYSAVGILGATVMPHSLFLGSALATQDRIDFRPEFDVKLALVTAESQPPGASEQVHRSWFLRWLDRCKESVLVAFRIPPPSAHGTVATRHSERENNPFLFVKAHIYHGTFDVIGSLLGFAVMINSLYVPPASLFAEHP